ncbi:DUF3667 domain-containing protein [Inhella gelatinilytica]|uniref:DUF3667 domain-containing protein n=1 Tax=Inhella gelatinilytica TaxID=2795030 RepID=A0A931IUW3_9BURK|nr:DUF3667 domain-containing protein [Inhella gelatinilytica]MBH9551445.1 DUF3667 domain-containing protein [Inhella gelatinilytica]
MTPHCLNCSTPLNSPYCPQCGQSAGVHRYTLAGLLHDVPHAVFHVDRGLWPTLWGVLVRPGSTIRGYLEGQRVRHFNPLTLLVLCASLYVACYGRADFLPQISRLGGEHMAAMGFDLLGWFTRAFSLLMLVAVPLQAWANWLCFRRERYNLAEHMVAVAFISAATTVLMVVPLFPLLWGLSRQGPAAQAWIGPLWLVGVALTTSYQSWALAQVFDRPGLRPKASWRVQGGMVLLLLMVAVPAFVMGVAWVVLRR